MGSFENEGIHEILGMNTELPNLSPVKILALITKVLQFCMINRVPLQRPSLGTISHSNMLGQPILRSSLNGGNLVGLRKFKNSLG